MPNRDPMLRLAPPHNEKDLLLARFPGTMTHDVGIFVSQQT